MQQLRSSGVELGPALRLLGPFGAFWSKDWALGATVWDPILKVQEP